MIIEIRLICYLLIVNGWQGKETSLPSRRTAETEKGAERLMEAIQLYKVPHSIISLRKLLYCNVSITNLTFIQCCGSGSAWIRVDPH
jgi:hypothetical protein